jgi:hypothetical protein
VTSLDFLSFPLAYAMLIKHLRASSKFVKKINLEFLIAPTSNIFSLSLCKSSNIPTPWDGSVLSSIRDGIALF